MTLLLYSFCIVYRGLSQATSTQACTAHSYINTSFSQIYLRLNETQQLTQIKFFLSLVDTCRDDHDTYHPQVHPQTSKKKCFQPNCI